MRHMDISFEARFFRTPLLGGLLWNLTQCWDGPSAGPEEPLGGGSPPRFTGEARSWRLACSLSTRAGTEAHVAVWLLQRTCTLGEMRNLGS